MKKPAIIVLLSACLLFPAAAAQSKSMEFTREYSYQAGEADSKLSSRTIALEQIKRLLLEELGTYLTSRTEVKNAQLTKDEIISFTAGSVATIIIKENWNGSEYWMMARISADPDQVAKAVLALRDDSEKSEELKMLRSQSEQAMKEVESLKRQLAELKKSGGQDKKIAEVRKEYENTVGGLSAQETAQQAYTLMREKKFSEAVEILDKVIKSDPVSVSPNLARVNAYVSLQQHDRALESINAAIAADPGQPAFYAKRAFVHTRMMHNDKALDDLSAAIRLKPRVPLFYSARGTVYSRVKNYDRAIEDHRQAVQLDQRNYRWVWNLAVSYKYAKRYDEALESYGKAISLNPTIANIYLSRADVYMVLRMKREAYNDVKKAAELGSPIAQKRLAAMGAARKPRLAPQAGDSRFSEEEEGSPADR